MARSVMARVYIGDVGTIVEKSPKSKVPANIDLSKLSFRDLCNLALAAGIDVRDIIGKEHCYEHQNMIAIGGRELPQGFNLFEHCIYCKNCWQFFRMKEALEFIE